MSGKILSKGNVLYFKCAATPTQIFTPQDLSNTKYNDTVVLTNKAQLVANGLTPCSMTGYQSPCVFTPVVQTPWLGTEMNITVNGCKILNSKSYKMCPMGQKISAVLSIPQNLEAKKNIPTAAVSGGAALTGMSAGVKSKADNKSAQQSSQSNSEKNEADIPEKQQPSEQSQKQVADESKQQQVVAGEKQEKVVDCEYALCNGLTCDKYDNCEYLKASHTLLPEEKEGASGILARNSGKKAKNTASSSNTRYGVYLDKKQKQLEGGHSDWSEAAHHLISINDAFGRIHELVKLAHFYEYDINGERNCIFLPGYASGESLAKKNELLGEEQMTEYKKMGRYAPAFEIMNITDLQWHQGSHNFSVDKNALENVEPEIVATLRKYNDILLEKLQSIISSRKGFCPAKDKEQKKQRFINAMNRLSDEINDKLLAFHTPKQSYPYFVSKAAIEYTYAIPKSGKAIFLTFSNKGGVKGWKFQHYKLTHYAKHNNKILLNPSIDEPRIFDYELKENIEEMIEYCGNVQHFFIFDKLGVTKLPFSSNVHTYYVKSESGNTKIFSESNSLWKDVKTNEMDGDKIATQQVINECGGLLAAVLTFSEGGYVSPSQIIMSRKKEVGI